MALPKESPWKEIEDISEGLRILSGQLANLISQLSGGQIPPAAPWPPLSPAAPGGTVTILIPNKASFTSGSFEIATVAPHTPINLPPLTVQDGYPVTIVAHPANVGNIYLGKNQSEVDDARKRFNGLPPGVAVSLRIKNLGIVWFDADNIGDGVSWIVETDS